MIVILGIALIVETVYLYYLFDKLRQVQNKLKKQEEEEEEEGGEWQ